MSIRRRALIAVSALMTVASLAVAAPVAAMPAPAGGGVGLTRIIDGLTDPVFVTHAGDDRLFIVEQVGRIKIARQVGSTWRITGTFLDIRSKVSGGSEQGLLGLAFHPGYASNRRFYVNYTNRSGDTVVAEYRRSATDAGRANPGSARVVLKVNQPYSNHNGGWIGFKGSYLYIALGDGGDHDDPGNRAQRLDTLLGKILRINPLDPDGSGRRRYSIPSSNPFVGRSGLDEIWSFGLRNPWRNSFDRVTGRLWIGDVGQGLWEEINRATSGRGTNFGWKRVEGRHLRGSANTLCSSNCKTLPIAEYGHGGSNCSVTGGYVARRSGAARYGQYFFGDYCSGKLWAIPAGFSGGSLPAATNTGLSISSFGEGRDGRIYLVNRGGSVLRVVGT